MYILLYFASSRKTFFRKLIPVFYRKNFRTANPRLKYFCMPNQFRTQDMLLILLFLILSYHSIFSCFKECIYYFSLRISSFFRGRSQYYEKVTIEFSSSLSLVLFHVEKFGSGLEGSSWNLLFENVSKICRQN